MQRYQNINDFLDKRVKATPDKIAIIYQAKEYTWRQVGDLSNLCAGMFLNKGIIKGSHVGILSRNTIEWVISYLSLTRIGAVPILINAQCTTKELMRILDYADVTYLLHGEGIKHIKYSQILEKIDFSVLKRFKYRYFIENRLLESINSANINAELVEESKKKVKSTDALCMLFTSGTTSTAKGVMLTHGSMINVAASAAEIMHWNVNDINCLSLPLFHCFGLSTGLLASIHSGGSMVISESSRTHELLSLIDKYRCTILNGVPTMFLAMVQNPRLCEYKIDSLKSGIIAGSSVCLEEYKQICDKLKLDKLQMSYGQTESSPSITFSGYDDSIELKSKSVGKVIPDVKMKIRSLSNGKECLPYHTGEIVIKGYNVMQGYYNLPDETRQTVDEGGWLHTGDIGYVDFEDNLYLAGRIKEMIIRGGENISPYEIEDCIRKIPGVQKVKVIGVPSKILQEDIAACIIMEDNMNISKESVKEHVRKELAGYKVPEYIMFMKEFPLTASGKIILKELKLSVQNILKS